MFSVYYRLSPETPFPGAVEDVVGVYEELLKTYKPHNIGIFGTSAGAIVSAEVLVKLRQLNLPMPAALGFIPVSPISAAPHRGLATAIHIEWLFGRHCSRGSQRIA